MIQLLAKTKVHRVWLVDESMKPVGVSTLSNILAAVVEYNQTASPRAADDAASGAAEKKVD